LSYHDNTDQFYKAAVKEMDASSEVDVASEDLSKTGKKRRRSFIIK